MPKQLGRQSGWFMDILIFPNASDIPVFLFDGRKIRYSLFRTDIKNVYNLLHNINLCLYITGYQKIFPLPVASPCTALAAYFLCMGLHKNTADRLIVNLSAAPYTAFYSLKPRT